MQLEVFSQVIRLDNPNSGLLKDMAIHQYQRSLAKIRKKYACIRNMNTVDVFLITTHIHGRASQAIAGKGPGFLRGGQ
jgi:hypothetical protein